MDDEERKAYESFEDLAEFIEKEEINFARVYRGRKGVITISMGIPKNELQEPFLKM